MAREIVFQIEIDVGNKETYATIEFLITKKLSDNATNTWIYEVWKFESGWKEKQPAVET